MVFEGEQEQELPILFNPDQKVIIQAWVDGLDRLEQQQKLFRPRKTYDEVLGIRGEINKNLSGSVGRNTIAKAVRVSIEQGLVSTDSLANVAPKRELDESESRVLKLISEGRDLEEISQVTEKSYGSVVRDMNRILKILGVKHFARAVAWQVVRESANKSV